MTKNDLEILIIQKLNEVEDFLQECADITKKGTDFTQNNFPQKLTKWNELHGEVNAYLSEQGMVKIKKVLDNIDDNINIKCSYLEKGIWVHEQESITTDKTGEFKPLTIKEKKLDKKNNSKSKWPNFLKSKKIFQRKRST